MKSFNLKLVGVLLAFLSLLLIPIYTILTLVLYFLNIYGFPPLIPEMLKMLDWKFFILVGGSLPIYAILANFIIMGYKKYKNPELDMKDLFIQPFQKIYQEFRDLLKLI